MFLPGSLPGSFSLFLSKYSVPSEAMQHYYKKQSHYTILFQNRM